jgi:hypothetical protein
MPTGTDLIDGLIELTADEEGDEFFCEKRGNGKGEEHRENERDEHGIFLSVILINGDFEIKANG